jgi:hypothetical protein
MLAHGAFGSSFAPVNGNTPSVATTEISVEIVTTATGAGLTDYAVESLLDLMFNSTAFTTTAGSTWIALCTATVADTDVADTDLTEASGNNYARKEVNENGGSSPAWDLAASGVVDNGATITFATPSGTWGLVTSCVIIDSASSTGNVLAYDNANVVDQTPTTDDTVQFATGAFDITMT